MLAFVAAATGIDASAMPAVNDVPLVVTPGGMTLMETPAAPIDRTIVFEQAASITSKGQTANSKFFDPARLPATFKATFHQSICTATLVGPRVLLTAAHCLDTRTSDSTRPRVVRGGIRLSVEGFLRYFRSCELAPAYTAAPVPPTRTPRNSKDWALCELAEVVDAPTETLSLDPAAITAAPVVLVAGFGCTGFTFASGIFQANATSGQTLTAGDGRLERDRRDGWVVTVGRLGDGRAIVCPGDSGGAAFLGASIVPGNDVGWRVFGVNSAVGPSDAQARAWTSRPPLSGTPLTNAEFISYFAPLADPAFTDFVKRFQARSPATRQICGVDLPPTAGRCRR